jgi:hypothetical protein
VRADLVELLDRIDLVETATMPERSGPIAVTALRPRRGQLRFGRERVGELRRHLGEQTRLAEAVATVRGGVEREVERHAPCAVGEREAGLAGPPELLVEVFGSCSMMART